MRIFPNHSFGWDEVWLFTPIWCLVSSRLSYTNATTYQEYTLKMQPPCDEVYKKIVAEKCGNPRINIQKVTNHVFRQPYRIATIEYEDAGVNKTQILLLRYRKKVARIALFKSYHFKEKLALIILKDARSIYGTRVTLDACFFNENVAIYGVDRPFFEHLHHDDEDNEEYFNKAICLLAKFHATSFAYKKTTIDKKLYQIDNVADLKQDVFFREFFDKLSGFIRKLLTDVRLIYWNTMLDKITLDDIEGNLRIIRRNMLNFNDNSTKILINGDYVCNNLFLFRELSACRIIDFSRAAYHSPLLDVFTFLTSFPWDNWQQCVNKSKNYYYVSLDLELMKLGFEIDDVFKKEEYEELFEKLSPVMCIIANLNTVDKFCTTQNTEDLTKLLNILDVLGMNPYPSRSVSFQDCYKIARSLKTNCSINSYEIKTKGCLRKREILELTLNYYGYESSVTLFMKRKITGELDKITKDLECSYKETMFYKKYIPLLHKHDIHILDDVTVKCHLADENKYVILEYLPAVYQKYMPSIPHEYLPQFIEILAKLHASCIILEELIELKTSKNYRLPDEFARELTETLYSSTRPAAMRRKAALDGVETLIKYARFDGDVEHLKQLASDAYDAQCAFVAPSTRWRNTLCHGNLSPDNFMLKRVDDDVSIKLIDFETYRYAPPAHDLMCLIYAYSCAETRDKYAECWKRDYYRKFSDILSDFKIDVATIVSPDEFAESCKFYEGFAITQATINFQIDYIPVELINPIVASVGNLYGNRGQFIRQIWLLDEVYRKKLTEAITEFRRFLLLKL